MNNILELGDKYYKEDNYEEAYKCYLEASLNEDPKACLALACMYLYGYYPKRDFKKAIKYFRCAFDYSETEKAACDAIYYLTSESDEFFQDKEAVNLYIELMNYLIEKGMWSACITLGGEYQTGAMVPKDINKAIELFNKAIVHGIDFGYHCLGEIYFKGDGVEKDYEKAYEYFNKVEGLSNVKIYYYAEMYRLGIIFEKDIEKAKELYLKLANDPTNVEYDDLYYNYALDRLNEFYKEEL